MGLDLSENYYAPWDIIEDVFDESFMIDALKKYREQHISEDDCVSDADVIRDIFQDIDNLERFFQILRDAPIFESRDVIKIVTLILVCEEIERQIDETPCSVADIFRTSIYHIIDDAKGRTYGEGENEYSEYTGIQILSKDWHMNPITNEGNIAYFLGALDEDGKSDNDHVYVWVNNEKVLLRRDGEIIQENNAGKGGEEKTGVRNGMRHVVRSIDGSTEILMPEGLKGGERPISDARGFIDGEKVVGIPTKK